MSQHWRQTCADPHAGATPCPTPEPETARALGRDEIHVWTVTVNARTTDNSAQLETLAPAERERAARFHTEHDRMRFVQRRVALRTILAGYIGVAPRDIAFTANPFGKPSIIAPQTSAGLSFNASHSDSVAIIAVARSARVGIDVERLRPVPEGDQIAARFFTANEAAELAALQQHDRLEGFFNAWTRKEAVVKALGGGLSIPLDSFEVSLRPDAPAAILSWHVPETPPGPWRIHHLRPAAGYVGCLVVDREMSVCQYRLEPVP